MPATRILVRRTERITPHMVRVTFDGENLAVDNGFTDRYVKLLFPIDGGYPDNLDALPRDQMPPRRTYTIRSATATELTIDFVHHGDTGLAGPWAANAKPGDELYFLGPGGAYAPDPAADWHLLVGDESALPAIGAALEQLPADAKVIAVVGSAEPQRLPHDVTWVDPADVVDTVRKLTFPAGRVHAFVHGEAGLVKQLRDHLTADRGVTREQLSISGYWRRGLHEDAFQAEKRATAAAAR
ncbi:siderophore-interacting protein [Kutzneria kofuensis]|uniref:NADPH-dependent ferric siderophore reductase n=1 Tax=Kutzneria kofuensis TaxID=103725 RepID=A0A7W9KC73_9PSEU|nr:siderophore-interacting protein [Kutzneria kofuensis]MBB5889129.1 NADPH-dependent ferric siderophore reductase [Kutzneria kofuensis]